MMNVLLALPPVPTTAKTPQAPTLAAVDQDMPWVPIDGLAMVTNIDSEGCHALHACPIYTCRY